MLFYSNQYGWQYIVLQCHSLHKLYCQPVTKCYACIDVAICQILFRNKMSILLTNTLTLLNITVSWNVKCFHGPLWTFFASHHLQRSTSVVCIRNRRSFLEPEIFLDRHICSPANSLSCLAVCLWHVTPLYCITLHNEQICPLTSIIILHPLLKKKKIPTRRTIVILIRTCVNMGCCYFCCYACYSNSTTCLKGHCSMRDRPFTPQEAHDNKPSNFGSCPKCLKFYPAG